MPEHEEGEVVIRFAWNPPGSEIPQWQKKMGKSRLSKAHQSFEALLRKRWSRLGHLV
jgi:hypothetical protein